MKCGKCRTETLTEIQVRDEMTGLGIDYRPGYFQWRRMRAVFLDRTQGAARLPGRFPRGTGFEEAWAMKARSIRLVMAAVLAAELLWGAGAAGEEMDSGEPPPWMDPFLNRMAALERQVEELRVQNADLRTQVDALPRKRVAWSEIEDMPAGFADGVDDGAKLMPYVTVVQGWMNGLEGPHIIIRGANVHVRSGSGATDDHGHLRGLGNLIVGYNEAETAGVGRRGSHNLVVGPGHGYASYGGFLAGEGNYTTAKSATVSGGLDNEAFGEYSSVSGGAHNRASGYESSVTAGGYNTASGNYSTVSAGYDNEASADWASVSGGTHNRATEAKSSVSGGSDNVASGDASSVSGGQYNEAGAIYSSVAAGRENLAGGNWSGVSGGKYNGAGGDYSSVGGGRLNDASGHYSSVSGGDSRNAAGTYNWVAGSLFEDD